MLVVDDQVTAAEGHRTFVERVPGFKVVGVVYDGPSAIAWCTNGGVDLLLLDLAMPEMHGMDVLRALHAMPQGPDVMVVTASRDLRTVRGAMRNGALLYVIKPFSFATLRTKLINYAEFTRAAAGEREILDQGELDTALAALREPANSDLPKPLAKETMNAVRMALLTQSDGLSASKVGEITGTSRVTARRYLEYLVSVGGCERELAHGRAGRPECIYLPRAGA